MGLLKPKWTSDRWWSQCPFNYCDHFGDKIELSKFCIICRDELVENRNIEHDYNIVKIPKEMWDKLSPKRQVSIDVKSTERLGDFVNPDDVPLCNMINHYGAYVEETLDALLSIPEEADIDLVNRAVDVLGHSRYYAHVKIMRAYDSALDEYRDPERAEESDAKTSALFSYVAIKRNSRALLALARHKPLTARKDHYLKLAATSIEVCDLIQKTFFPGNELSYEEFGCDYFKTT